MTKQRHINERTFPEEWAKTQTIFDDLCPGCRLRLLSYAVAYYVNQIQDDQQQAYVMAFIRALSSALEFVSIEDMGEISDGQTLQ